MALRFVVPAAAAALFGMASAAGLEDIDHVVLFMQENRAFDHYFGTMAGTRGFNDANLQMNDGVPVWNQVVTPAMSPNAKYVKPWYINYLGGDWVDATQCMYGGSNGWYNNHAAWNHGLNNHWASNNTPWSIGFYKRQDVPTQWALAENWVIGDMYQESVVASTSPNRVTWASGSINAPGSPQKPDQGGNPYIDNNETPGCESGGINCYPLKWKTAAEHYEDAGVSWSVFQDADNFDDNPLAWFEQFQNVTSGPLFEKGMKGQTLDAFYARAANGTLPAVSYIVGPAELAEHAPYSPHDGAWLQDQITRAVINSPAYNRTALIVSFDETGGWADHVDPFRAPDGTPGEWMDDPYNQVGHTFLGPGFRVPFYIISPFTRKGGVYTEHSDHNSQILFIEKWQAAKGKNVVTNQMMPWRRANMGDLVNAFDFENPDFSIPDLPVAPPPHKDGSGNYDGAAFCSSKHSKTRPPVPYTGNGVIDDLAATVEQGFKPVRGQLTEGRFLVFEAGSFALTHPTDCKTAPNVRTSPSTSKHENISQRWVVHVLQLGGDEFTLTSASDGRYLCNDGKLCRKQSDAIVFKIGFEPSKGYSFQVKGTSKYLAINDSHGPVFDGGLFHWSIYSVNYANTTTGAKQ